MQLLFPGCAVLDMMRPLRVVPDRRRFEVIGASVIILPARLLQRSILTGTANTYDTQVAQLSQRDGAAGWVSFAIGCPFSKPKTIGRQI